MRILLILYSLSFCLIANAKCNIDRKSVNAINMDKVREMALRSAQWSETNLLSNMSYQNICVAFGILKVADATGNEILRKGVEEAFRAELLEGVYPHRDNANNPAHKWFGFIPLELYKQTKNPLYLKRGIEMAEEQYLNADKNGMPAYTQREYIDDIYGATVMQSLAYSGTGEEKYLERAVQQVLFYSEKFMQENGLFLHNPKKSPFFWGRGNGWCAAAYSELLAVMPVNHPKRDAVLVAYRRMMKALLKYQGLDGMWFQLLDGNDSWAETSCSAMFLFAMTEGVRNGWLPAKPYCAAIVKTWHALKGYVDQQGKIREVCAGTSFGDRKYYLNRPRLTGDAHGQAALLWASASMLDWLQK